MLESSFLAHINVGMIYPVGRGTSELCHSDLPWAQS